MNNKYIIFSAVLSLRKFTMQELSEETSVAKSNVNLILNQSERKRLLKKVVDKKENQPDIYQLRDDKIAILQEEVETLFSEFIVQNKNLVVENELTNCPLFGQKMADKLLSRDFIKAETSEKKREILDLTQNYIDESRDKIKLFPISDAETLNFQYIQSKKKLFDSLLDLECLVLELPADETISLNNRTLKEFSREIEYLNNTITAASFPTSVMSVNTDSLLNLKTLVSFVSEVISENKSLFNEFSSSIAKLKRTVDLLHLYSGNRNNVKGEK